MRYSTQIKPVSFVKENASRLDDALDETGDPVILTEGGKARAVLMSVHEFERLEDTLALLQIVRLAEKDIAAGRTVPLDEAFDRVTQTLHAKYG